ncbi:MAG: undecaprenyl-phosphate glucose phosphotransferase [Deltaproteobacteria bacterium]
MLKKYGNVFISLFICSDILLIFIIWIFSYMLTEKNFSGHLISTNDFLLHIRIFIILIPVFLYSTRKFDFYAPRRFNNNYSEFKKVLMSVFFTCFLFFPLVFFIEIFRYSYVFILVFSALCAGIIFAYHALVNFILKNFRVRGFNLRRILIVGCGEIARKAASKFLEHHEFGLDIVGFLNNNRDAAEENILGIPVLGKYDMLNEVVSQKSVDIVFFALAPNEERLLRFLVEKINNDPVDIRIALDTNGVFLLKNSFSKIDDIPVISLRESRLIGFQEIAKRTLDFILASIIILLAAPILILVGICIKITSPGPVFYIQERVSLDGKRFKLLKFRTMHVNAEKYTGPVWTAENDPRRTRIGYLLRRTGLDELPQFINVLKGEMSIVGPRPERPEFITEFKKLHPHYMLRHTVKTGITGWAQIHGLRGNTPLEKRLKHDLYYINNFSFWLDIKIMFMTIPAIFKGRGAC